MLMELSWPWTRVKWREGGGCSTPLWLQFDALAVTTSNQKRLRKRPNN